MALETMMAIEYAALRNISNQCVCKALRKSIEEGTIKSKTLTGVKSIKSYGRTYVLEVNVELAKKSVKIKK